MFLYTWSAGKLHIEYPWIKIATIGITKHSIMFHGVQTCLLFCPGNKLQMCNYGSIVSVLFPRLSVLLFYNVIITMITLSHKEGNVVSLNGYNILCNQCLLPLKLWVWFPPVAWFLESTVFDKIWVTWNISMVFAGYSGFLYQSNIPPRCN